MIGVPQAGAERDLAMRLKLQVSVLQGTIEVLNRQLAEANALIRSHNKEVAEKERSSFVVQSSLR